MKQYSLSEIAQILGVDEKQLHHYAHKGLIDPKMSNDRSARFREIDCARLRLIKQADELGYEPEAIFRLIGKPDEVLDGEGALASSEEFAMAKYKQIYNELNHCEPLDQLNKQCDLRLLIGYIKHLKELRTGTPPKSPKQPKTEPPSKPSATVKGVKASVGGANQTQPSAPSPSIRRYSVAKYWEYMKKVEELQKEIADDTLIDDEGQQSVLTEAVHDDMELLELPKESDGEKISGDSFFDGMVEKSEPISPPDRAFDKQQSWGMWILVGAFLVLIAGGYFFLSDHKAPPPKANLPTAETDTPKTPPSREEPVAAQQPTTGTVASKGSQTKPPLSAEEQSNRSAPSADLEVGNLNLWHDSQNNVYRADFTITNNSTADDGEPVSGYAFVYLRFGDQTSNPKSLLLPSGEVQTKEPTRIQKGARFSIRHFKQMQISSVSDLSPSDTLYSDILVYSHEGKLLLAKNFDVSMKPFHSASSEEPAATSDVGKVAETPPAPIEPVEPGPPPIAVAEPPQPSAKDKVITQPASETRDRASATSHAEPGPGSQPPATDQPASAGGASPSVPTPSDSGIEEKTIAAIQPNSGSNAPLPQKPPESGAERSQQIPEQSHKPQVPGSPSAKIQSTGNPDAAKWEQKSYNAAVQGDFDQAIVDATKALELDPGRVNPYINRSWAYLEKNMLDLAIQDCKTALAIDPQNAFAYNNRGLVYQRKGKTALAQEDYSKACELGLELGCQNRDDLTKQSRVTQLIDQSQNAFNANDWDSVIRITSEVIDLDPQNAVAYTNRSAAYAQKDFLNKALKDSNQALRLNPDFPLAYNNRGYVLELLGNNRKASQDYLKSCSLGLDLGCKNFERLNKTQ